jgi:hypothetical protein
VPWRPNTTQHQKKETAPRYVCYCVVRPSEEQEKPWHTRGVVSAVACRGFERQVGGNNTRRGRSGSKPVRQLFSSLLFPFLPSFHSITPTLFLSFSPSTIFFFTSLYPSCWPFYQNTAGSNWRPRSRIVQTRLGCRLQAPWGIARWELPRHLHSILRTELPLLR